MLFPHHSGGAEQSIRQTPRHVHSDSGRSLDLINTVGVRPRSLYFILAQIISHYPPGTHLSKI
jgi:hypothetical protein